METCELPLVASSITSSADAMMQGLVASALTHLLGETNFIQVTPSSDPGLPKFNSINIPIDANVSTIGAATFAAECGFSDAQIRSMGRWKSDAFRKYIRSPGLCSTP